MATENSACDYSDIVDRLQQLADGDDVRLDEQEICFARQEALRRHDGDVLFTIAEDWYQIRNEDQAAYLALLPAAAEGGSVRAHFWLAQECRLGKHLPIDYGKAYACYEIYDQKGKGLIDEVSPIDPEENLAAMRSLKEYGVAILEICDHKVIAGILLDTGDYGSTIEESIPWWEFVLGKHPSRALKCGLGNWYVSIGELDKGVRLIEESAKEGFRDASSMLALYYADDSHKDIDRARYWLKEAENSGAKLPRTAKKLGVECESIRRLKEEAQGGDMKAAAVLAAAYYHGFTDGRCGEPRIYCDRDMKLARDYGEQACVEDEGASMLYDLLDTNKKDEYEFINELTQHLEGEDSPADLEDSIDDNELVQDEEGNWMYRGDLED